MNEIKYGRDSWASLRKYGVAVDSGVMNIQVSNGRKLLIKLVGTMKGISLEDGNGLTKSLQASFKPLITNIF